MTRPLLLFAVLAVALCSLSAWGDEASQHPAPPDETEALSKHEVECGPYAYSDVRVSECFVYEESLIPRLEYSTEVSRYLLRPPEGVIVLYPDGSWEEAAVCPPEFVEETRTNNWRFCRGPERRTRIPRMWNPPINGIPYEEAEAIAKEHEAALMAIDGVNGAGLVLHYILVYTDQPELVPEAIEGIPVRTTPPFVFELLSHATASQLRPLKAAAGIGSPAPSLGFGVFRSGTLTAVALAAGEPWLILPAHLLDACHESPPCPIGTGPLHTCTKYGGTRDVDQPWNGPFSEVVGWVPRWDPIPKNSNTPTTLDVGAAFADMDTDATKVHRPRLVSPNIFVLWPSV